MIDAEANAAPRGGLGTPLTGVSLVAVTSQIPWPLDRGGHLRTFHLLKALAQAFRVRLVTTVSNNSPVSDTGIAALASSSSVETDAVEFNQL